MREEHDEKTFIALLQNPDLEEWKPYLRLNLINTETLENQYKLRHAVSFPVKDMAAVPVLRMEVESGVFEAVIMPQMVDQLGVTKEEFLRITRRQAQENSPLVIRNMADIIQEMSGEETAFQSQLPMFIATNRDTFHGASVICYPGFLEKAEQAVGKDFYLLPSSVHEVILVNDSMIPNYMTPNEMKQMVTKANATEVLEKERLTDNAYHFDRVHGLETVEEYTVRMQKRQLDQNRNYSAYDKQEQERELEEDDDLEM